MRRTLERRGLSYLRSCLNAYWSGEVHRSAPSGSHGAIYGAQGRGLRLLSSPSALFIVLREFLSLTGGHKQFAQSICSINCLCFALLAFSTLTLNAVLDGLPFLCLFRRHLLRCRSTWISGLPVKRYVTWLSAFWIRETCYKWDTLSPLLYKWNTAFGGEMGDRSISNPRYGLFLQVSKSQSAREARIFTLP